MRGSTTILAIIYSLALHLGIGATLLFAMDWTRSRTPEVPLAIKASVVTEIPSVVRDPEPLPPQPQPEPEPEPELEPPPEPEPDPEPTPDPEELSRIAAEEAMRQEELARERERMAREEDAARQRQREAEAERRRREEAEQERRRLEAERRRLEEIERQRRENERRRQEAEAAERQAQLQRELAAEQERLDAMNAGDLERYSFALRQAIQRNWVRPPSATASTRCEVSVRQLPDGTVTSVVVESCNGDDAVRRSVKNAVEKASPRPVPDNPSLFERNLRFVFEPTQ